MKKMFSLIMTAFLLFGMATGVSAAVTLDSETGTGFVGKGDVQTALGLNNAGLQAVAENLVFTYNTVDSYVVTVEWITGEGTKGEQAHIVTHDIVWTLSGEVLYDAKKKNQFVGFNLNGFGSKTTAGDVPAIGDVYPGNSDHIVTSVELVSSSTGGLYVNGVALQ